MNIEPHNNPLIALAQAKKNGRTIQSEDGRRVMTIRIKKRAQRWLQRSSVQTNEETSSSQDSNFGETPGIPVSNGVSGDSEANSEVNPVQNHLRSPTGFTEWNSKGDPSSPTSQRTSRSTSPAIFLGKTPKKEEIEEIYEEDPVQNGFSVEHIIQEAMEMEIEDFDELENILRPNHGPVVDHEQHEFFKNGGNNVNLNSSKGVNDVNNEENGEMELSDEDNEDLVSNYSEDSCEKFIENLKKSMKITLEATKSTNNVNYEEEIADIDVEGLSDEDEDLSNVVNGANGPVDEHEHVKLAGNVFDRAESVNSEDIIVDVVGLDENEDSQSSSNVGNGPVDEHEHVELDGNVDHDENENVEELIDVAGCGEEVENNENVVKICCPDEILAQKILNLSFSSSSSSSKDTLHGYPELSDYIERLKQIIRFNPVEAKPILKEISGEINKKKKNTNKKDPIHIHEEAFVPIPNFILREYKNQRNPEIFAFLNEYIFPQDEQGVCFEKRLVALKYQLFHAHFRLQGVNPKHPSAGEDSSALEMVRKYLPTNIMDNLEYVDSNRRGLENDVIDRNDKGKEYSVDEFLKSRIISKKPVQINEVMVTSLEGQNLESPENQAPEEQIHLQNSLGFESIEDYMTPTTVFARSNGIPKTTQKEKIPENQSQNVSQVDEIFEGCEIQTQKVMDSPMKPLRDRIQKAVERVKIMEGQFQNAKASHNDNLKKKTNNDDEILMAIKKRKHVEDKNQKSSKKEKPINENPIKKYSRKSRRRSMIRQKKRAPKEAEKANQKETDNGSPAQKNVEKKKTPQDKKQKAVEPGATISEPILEPIEVINAPLESIEVPNDPTVVIDEPVEPTVIIDESMCPIESMEIIDGSLIIEEDSDIICDYIKTGNLQLNRTSISSGSGIFDGRKLPMQIKQELSARDPIENDEYMDVITEGLQAVDDQITTESLDTSTDNSFLELMVTNMEKEGEDDGSEDEHESVDHYETVDKHNKVVGPGHDIVDELQHVDVDEHGREVVHEHNHEPVDELEQVIEVVHDQTDDFSQQSGAAAEEISRIQKSLQEEDPESLIEITHEVRSNPDETLSNYMVKPSLSKPNEDDVIYDGKFENWIDGVSPYLQKCEIIEEEDYLRTPVDMQRAFLLPSVSDGASEPSSLQVSSELQNPECQLPSSQIPPSESLTSQTSVDLQNPDLGPTELKHQIQQNLPSQTSNSLISSDLQNPYMNPTELKHQIQASLNLTADTSHASSDLQDMKSVLQSQDSTPVLPPKVQFRMRQNPTVKHPIQEQSPSLPIPSSQSSTAELPNLLPQAQPLPNQLPYQHTQFLQSPTAMVQNPFFPQQYAPIFYQNQNPNYLPYGYQNQSPQVLTYQNPGQPQLQQTQYTQNSMMIPQGYQNQLPQNQLSQNPSLYGQQMVQNPSFISQAYLNQNSNQFQGFQYQPPQMQSSQGQQNLPHQNTAYIPQGYQNYPYQSLQGQPNLNQLPQGYQIPQQYVNQQNQNQIPQQQPSMPYQSPNVPQGYQNQPFQNQNPQSVPSQVLPENPTMGQQPQGQLNPTQLPQNPLLQPSPSQNPGVQLQPHQTQTNLNPRRLQQHPYQRSQPSSAGRLIGASFRSSSGTPSGLILSKSYRR